MLSGSLLVVVVPNSPMMTGTPLSTKVVFSLSIYPFSSLISLVLPQVLLALPQSASSVRMAKVEGV